MMLSALLLLFLVLVLLFGLDRVIVLFVCVICLCCLFVCVVCTLVCLHSYHPFLWRLSEILILSVILIGCSDHLSLEASHHAHDTCPCQSHRYCC